MANPDVKLDIAETSEVSKVASNPASESEPKVERVVSAKRERLSLCDARRIWRRFSNTEEKSAEASEELKVASKIESKSKEETPDSPQASFLLKWKKIFLASCVFAVLLDPLFLYIPMIDQDRTCFRVDNNLTITTLVLRSLTDLFYIMDIAFQFYESESSSGFIKKSHHESHPSALQYLRDLLQAIAKTLWKSRVLIDILAIIPLPQVAILSFFSKMRVSSSLNVSKAIMNLVVLMQYLPRVLRIYLSCIDLRKTPNEGTGDIKIWVKGVLNFFMYILAGHVLGAVWYFFAIQRMTNCWQNACERNGTVCVDRDFGCASLPPTPDIASKVLNDSCIPVEKPDKSQFDFGIFSNLLQSEITGSSTNPLQKFTNCFCWGLRNLSSLGSNLAPSTNTWENLFVTFISIIGLLLFIYLIGNLQTYMQLDVTRIAERRHKKRVEEKLEKKSEDIKRWLSKNGIPEGLLTENELLIKKNVEQELEENRDVNLESFHTITPPKLQDRMKRFSPLSRLKQAPAVHYMDGIVLEEICDHLKPVKYSDTEDIIREGGSLDKMIFIVEGQVIVEKGNSSRGEKPGARELYGEKLLAWPSSPTPELRPSATVSVKAIGNVEALFLQYENMEKVGSKFFSQFKYKGGIVEQLANSPTPPRILTKGELSRATNKFSKEVKIGEGGAGSTVYKGTLSDEKEVAIKVPSSSMPSSQTTQSDIFMNEVIVLSQTFHRNVVRLFGVCLETKPPIVVYEFVGKGTLDEHIQKKNNRRPLPSDLRVRLDIAVDIARGLEYLHNLPSMRIVHRDVKSSNVLLDGDWTAKVSDFTASRFVSEDKDAVLKLVKDTLEYTPPEYHESNTLTDKGDVYCFGVVLMELMTGQMMKEMELTKYSASSVNERCLDEKIGQEIVLDERNSEIVKEVAALAIACIKLKGEERPTMKEVAKKLKELKTMLKANFTPSPKQTDH